MLKMRLWKIYNEVGSAACATGHYDLAQRMFDAALEECSTNKALRREKIRSLIGLADALLLQSQPDIALAIYNRAVNIFARLANVKPADKHVLAHALEAMGQIAMRQNSSAQALKYMLRSVRITKELPNSEPAVLARRLKETALIYYQQGDQQMSFEFLQRSKHI